MRLKSSFTSSKSRSSVYSAISCFQCAWSPWFFGILCLLCLSCAAEGCVLSRCSACWLQLLCRLIYSFSTRLIFARQEIVILTILVNLLLSVSEKTPATGLIVTDISLGILIGPQRRDSPETALSSHYHSAGCTFTVCWLRTESAFATCFFWLQSSPVFCGCIRLRSVFSFNTTFYSRLLQLWGRSRHDTRILSLSFSPSRNFTAGLFHMTNITYYTPMIKAQLIAFLSCVQVSRLVLGFTRFSRNVHADSADIYLRQSRFPCHWAFCAAVDYFWFFPFGYLMLFLLADSNSKN